MSSTTNVQNFLVNVFRPVYTYDSTTTLFTPKLELSNIDNYSGNTISVFTAAVGDSNSNVYVGSNAGNSYTLTKLCRNVTAVGYGAGSNISNVSNSTYLGFYAGAGAATASSVVAIGANANGNGTSNIAIGPNSGGVGSSNVFVGTSTGGSGSSNVFVGAGISGAASNSILIGSGVSGTATDSVLIGSGTTSAGSNSILIGNSITGGSTSNLFKIGPSYLTGNMSTKWLGIGTTTPYDVNNRLDVSGNLYVLGQQGINMVPVRTLDVNGNFRASDANGTLDFNLGVTSSSNGFASRTGTLSNAAIGSTTTIGPAKKGAILVSAQDTASTGHYASSMVYCMDPADASTAAALSSPVQTGDVYVVFQSGGSNIQISNATSVRSISWTITYFPLP